MLGEIGIESGLDGPHPFEMVAGNGWNTGLLAARFNALRIPACTRCRDSYTARGRAQATTAVWLQMDPRNAGNLPPISYQAIQILQRNVGGFEPFGARAAPVARRMEGPVADVR